MKRFTKALTAIMLMATVVCAACKKDHENMVTIPTVETAEVVEVGTTTASCCGIVTADGGAQVTECGVCWDTNHNPTVNGSHVSSGGGLGKFTCNLTDLSANTTYYVRAYAKNSKGVAYGEEKNFATLVNYLPEVTTVDVTDITQTKATGGGEVTSNGGTTVFEQGVCWSINPNPTTSDSYAISGSYTGLFTVDMTDLTAGTTYYVRAYAINSIGVGYGNQVTFTTLSGSGGGVNTPTGAIGGIYSVSAMDKVYFSQGNLQYQASTNTWRFAEKQYYTIGENNCIISPSYSGWIDLFGWGTSGYHDSGDVYNTNYQPWATSSSVVNTTYNYYGYGPSTNVLSPDITGNSAEYDWGVYNAISNGGNQAGLWRTLTKAEWLYLLTRYTSSEIRYALAQVNGVNGVILVPDDWNVTTYSLNNANDCSAGFTSNVVDEMMWQDTFEPAGAVFLPAAGGRQGTFVTGVGSNGHYWSSSSYFESESAYQMGFCDLFLNMQDHASRNSGLSVRLVCPAQ